MNPEILDSGRPSANIKLKSTGSMSWQPPSHTLAEQLGPAELSLASFPIMRIIVVCSLPQHQYASNNRYCLSKQTSSAKWATIPSSKVTLVHLIQTKRENPMLTPQEFLSLKMPDWLQESKRTTFFCVLKLKLRCEVAMANRPYILSMTGSCLESLEFRPDTTCTLRPLPKWRNECFSASKCRR